MDEYNSSKLLSAIQVHGYRLVEEFASKGKMDAVNKLSGSIRVIEDVLGLEASHVIAQNRRYSEKFP